MDFKLVDLSHTLDESIPTWTGDCGFSKSLQMDYSEGARVQEFRSFAGAGTHIDAPSHFTPGGRDVDELTLEELCVPICVVDMSEELHLSAQVRVKDFEDFEVSHGRVPKGSVVLFHTGWSVKWGKEYRREESPLNPSVHPDLGDLLLERGVAGIGIDTLSPDPYGGDYPIHHKLLGSDKYILENLTNLDKLPKIGAHLIALPVKISGATESPTRVIALIKR